MKFYILLIIFIIVSEFIYPFGKNKIAYYTYKWEILETAHFRIYIARDDLFLSNQISSMAEEIFTHHTNTFNYVPKTKIKILLYRNQIDFQQNNISDWLGPETGGFTEFVKGRVVVPFSTFYPDFNHVLAHELTHAFQGHVWGKGTFSILTVRDIDIPLWMVEGAAEYNSIGVDPECEMMIADGVINGSLPSLMKLSDPYGLSGSDYYYIYKEGQIFYDFINAKFGSGIFSKLNNSIADNRSFNIIITNTFNMTLDEINAEFFDHLRKKYLPEISNLSSVEVAAKKLIKEDSIFNMNPVCVSSNLVAFISDRKIYPSILLFEREKKSLKRVIKGGFNEEFLEFQYGKRNNLSVSSNGILCFVSRSGGEDAIHLYNIKSKKIERFTLPFRIINSPDISSDGLNITFSGEADQQTDIYIYNLQNKQLKKITDSKFYNTQPRFLGQNRIVYSSNRKKGDRSPNMDIIIYNLDSNEIEQVLDTGFSDEYPSISKNGKKIAFVRMDVHPALMIYSIDEKTLYEELKPTGGILTPSFEDDGSIIFTAYHKNSYNIFEYTPQYKNRVTNSFLIYDKDKETSVYFTPLPGLTKKDYKPEVSIDNLFGALTLNTSFGIAAIGVLSLSDLLGDDRYQLLMDTSLVFDNTILNYLNIDFTYLSLKYRHNYGFRIFHYSNYFYEFSTFQDFFNMEKVYNSTYGAFILYSYPFTTFDRLDAEIGYRGFSYINNIQTNDTGYIYDLSYQSRNLVNLSFVHDSTLEDYTGPVDGIRYEVLLSKSFPFFADSLNYEKIVLDFRSYWMLFPGYSFAFRAVAGKIFDTDRDSYPFYIGGFNSVRGYPLWSFSGDNIFLFNFELRVPFIYDWTVGFPIPIRMPTIWGVIFWDFGSAWESGLPYQLYDSSNGFQFKDLKSGIGFGFRLVIVPGIKLMVDFAAPYDGVTLPPITDWPSFWLIGIDF